MISEQRIKDAVLAIALKRLGAERFPVEFNLNEVLDMVGSGYSIWFECLTHPMYGDKYTVTLTYPTRPAIEGEIVEVKPAIASRNHEESDHGTDSSAKPSP